MVKKVNISGYDQFVEAFKEHACKDISVFVLFCGSKDLKGESWCPDCVAAAPIVKEALKGVSDGAVFLYCEVGDRAFWKDPTNSFRTDSNLNLTAVPTLLKLGGAQRLVEEQCLDKNLVEMMFEDE